jgi:lipoprotein-anchoring transpeptidase ErfK/SrfK
VAPKSAGLILCLAAACVLGAGAGSARADGGGTTTTTEPTIQTGVTIGPVAVGGMTAADATQAVLDAYTQPLVLRVGRKHVSLLPRQFHLMLPLAAAVQTALTAAPDTAIPLRASVNVQHVAAWVKALAKQTDRKPVAGRLVLRHDRPFFTHDHPGRKILRVATTMRIRDAIRDAVRTPLAVPLRKLAARKAKAEPVIVIHTGLNRLMFFRGTHLVRAFPVATGMAQYPTPLGRFQIVVKELNPWWYPPTQDAWAQGLQPVPPGPGNPLGTRWMGLDSPGVGIHGTDEPWSIGHSESHGCIRMQVPSAEWLFNRVQIGTPVFIVPA